MATFDWVEYWLQNSADTSDQAWWRKIMPKPALTPAALKYMADWFQVAAVGSCIRSLSGAKEFTGLQPRPTGAYSDYTWKVDRSWNMHDQVHGPLFDIKTTYRISETAQLCAKPTTNFTFQLKSETFERHTLECANQILHSVGALERAENVTETCPTCHHSTPRIQTLPSQGSGFVERVGRYPDPQTDRWRLMYRPSQLLRFVKVNDTEGYYTSSFRLVIDWAGAINETGVGGKPYYWRLDPRGWYLK